MSSTQDERSEEEGESIARAREAAREIAHDRTERARVLPAEAGSPPYPEPHRAGVLETVRQGAISLVSAVGRTLGVATDDTAAPAGKAAESSQSTTHKATDTAAATKDRLGEHKGAAAEKASDAADTTKNMLGEHRDTAAEKAMEAKDTTSTVEEKAREYGEGSREKVESAAEAESPEQKLEEYKESAADAARKAMEYLTVRTEEIKEPGGATKASVEATEEVARQEVDAARQRAEQVAERERRWMEEEQSGPGKLCWATSPARSAQEILTQIQPRC